MVSSFKGTKNGSVIFFFFPHFDLRREENVFAHFVLDEILRLISGWDEIFLKDLAYNKVSYPYQALLTE